MSAIDLDEAYHRSLELMRRNSCPAGFLASSAIADDNYHAVWGRDGSICASAALLSGDATLIETARVTLRTLAAHQADNGQIPSYLPVDGNGEVTGIVYGGHGRITTIDSNLWFLIACQTAFEELGDEAFLERDLTDVYERTIRHLRSLDSDNCGLLEIPVGGDWTDILDRSYHILYDEVLWFRALRCASLLCEELGEKDRAASMQRRANAVRDQLNAHFWWDAEGRRRAVDAYDIHNDVPEEEFPFYQTHLQPFSNHWYHRFDAFANVLAALMGVADAPRVGRILERVRARGLAQVYPLQVLDPPIRPGEWDAHSLDAAKEPLLEYHNGGIWPLAGGFWILLLSELGFTEEAEANLARLAAGLRAGGASDGEWGFHEYFHGQTGAPGGKPWQTWSAAAYVLGYAHVRHRKTACFEKGACGI